MARNPTPILVVSAFIGRDGSYSRSDALAAGALDVVEKPMPDPDWQRDAGALVEKVKSLAQVPVVTHMYGGPRAERRPPSSTVPLRAATSVVAIGASTGGPKIVDELLSVLPHNYAPAVIVVQHMAEGFMAAMITSLRRRCALEVKVAEEGDKLQSGRVLFAPPAAHLAVTAGGRVRIDHREPVAGFRPSVDVTFTSLAETYGARAAGILLTGMGADGAEGLLAIRRADGKTMVQDEASCVVFGMPRAAIELGAVQHVLSPAALSRHLVALHRLRSKKTLR